MVIRDRLKRLFLVVLNKASLMSFARLLRLLAVDGFHHAKSLFDKSVDVSPIPHRRHCKHVTTSWDRCR